MIAIDIDGTLLPSVGAAIRERTRQALRDAEQAGIEIVIATGRRQAYAMPLLEPVGLRPETVIVTSNGTVTRTFSGERLERALLPLETARELCGALRQFGGATVFTFDHDGPGELVIESMEPLAARVPLWVEANRPWIKEIQPLEQAFETGESPVQGMVCGTLEEMRYAETWLAASHFANKIEMHQTQYPARSLSILDVLPPGCSKGVALRRLAERRGLSPSQIMAIGDNYNDLEMLEYAGHAVLMANAAPELLQTAQERAWHVTRPNDEDGVAVVIENLLSGKYEPASQVSVVE